MSQLFDALQPRHIEFIGAQKIFFVATATADSHISLSPKGMDTLRVLSPTQVLWLNCTGSGNETAAHVQCDPRMTIMLCAFEGAPLVLRIYGKARVLHRDAAEWDTLCQNFAAGQVGARQLFLLDIDLVQTSCGFAVPLLDYRAERDTLQKWAQKKGEAGIQQYWRDKNQTSIDGIPSHISAHIPGATPDQE